jgi:TRAP-type C4-dicarboxylate transport system substrate-binding protein
MNRDVFDSLTPAQQKICEIAAAEATSGTSRSSCQQRSALARLQAAGVKTLKFPDDVWDAFARRCAGNP